MCSCTKKEPPECYKCQVNRIWHEFSDLNPCCKILMRNVVVNKRDSFSVIIIMNRINWWIIFIFNNIKKKKKTTTQGSSQTPSLACFVITYFCNHCNIKLNKRSLTPRWPLTPSLLRSHVWLYPRIIVSKSNENTSKFVDTVTLFSKTWTKVHWPLDDLWPHVCWGHMCDSTQGSLCPNPMKINQNMWIQWPFFLKLEQRSFTCRWPLTPSFLRSHVWLYPRIIVSKSNENTSKFVDTVTLFSKTWTKGHWPLDDLWPHVCWGRMCDSTQGSLCPSPMGIHQCMWIQWSILKKNTTYYIHTTYRMKDHIVSFWTQFRRDKKGWPEFCRMS